MARDLLKYIKFSKLPGVFDFTDLSSTGNLRNVCFSISVRTAKHYDPKFKWLRSKKVIPVDLPHTEKAQERQRATLRDTGIRPRYWKFRPLTITTAGEIIDPYKPPPGDGKVSVLSKVEDLPAASKTKIRNMTAMRTIKNYEPEFKTEIFLQEAQDIYINAHKVLMEKDRNKLQEYVTPKAIQEMLDGVKNNTLRWTFIKSLEPPQLVQARVTEVLIKTNLFAQVTIRFHTKQSLAVYDRFGRLMFGSETVPKDVLEYVIFEKHINNKYGVWRMHGKIIPELSEPIAMPTRTYKLKQDFEEDEEDIPELQGLEKPNYKVYEELESDAKH